MKCHSCTNSTTTTITRQCCAQAEIVLETPTSKAITVETKCPTNSQIFICAKRNSVSWSLSLQQCCPERVFNSELNWTGAPVQFSSLFLVQRQHCSLVLGYSFFPLFFLHFHIQTLSIYRFSEFYWWVDKEPWLLNVLSEWNCNIFFRSWKQLALIFQIIQLQAVSNNNNIGLEWDHCSELYRITKNWRSLEEGAWRVEQSINLFG